MTDSPHLVIAVDGTAASGKSTFSSRLAERFGFVYVNTGAMYRGVTWYLLQHGVSLHEPDAVASAISSASVFAGIQDNRLVFRVGDQDPIPHARHASVNEGVSLVAQVAEVRRLLVLEQQKLAAAAPLVMEGRDIGSVVFPHTPYKFFLDADAEVRVQRRSAQGEKDIIQQRDVLDSRRKTSPLVRLEDAFYIDSSALNLDDMLALALQHLAACGLTPAPKELAG